MSVRTIPEQYYVFEGPDGRAWCESFNGSVHVTAPTPFGDVEEALWRMDELHPDRTVDTLIDPDDIEDAMRFAGELGWATVDAQVQS